MKDPDLPAHFIKLELFDSVLTGLNGQICGQFLKDFPSMLWIPPFFGMEHS
ncbi:hypothetical protein SAMN02746095_03175 [Acidocella aminolytica 101 = DSM 11237]|uniref:hypothetical protein n=1 Tax=Acidocella aminolytica TaxID=33998 RepID=UPI0009226CB8|nr:hypothetical protein [Acidocella aminolytica]SHF41633.1 hypothetical protein SAMN02746095_03175 [Acidocella aminolytica 101 = DSM 11237]